MTKLITFDAETFFDADYTLRKLATSEYIRDKRFEIISASIKIDNGPAQCYFGRDAIATALRTINWNEAELLAHHTQFDGLILSHHFGIIPKIYRDTMGMARALHPKMERANLEQVAKHYNVQNKLEMPDFKGKHLTDLTQPERDAIAIYNNGDVESCYQAYQHMVKVLPASELDLVDITTRMFADPVLRVDMKIARKELRDEVQRKTKVIAATGLTEDILASNPKFVAELVKLGVEIPTKNSPTVKLEDGSPKQIPAVAKNDEGLQALLSHPDPRVVNLVEARLAVKSTISETRAARMLLRGKGGMKLPAYYNYALAHTYRWSGGDKFNLQNFKQAQKTGGGLRKAIKAPVGHHLVVVDAAQIEARITAWLADEEWVLEAFRQKRDIYSEFASEAYGRKITKEDKEERFVGKVCQLGLGFMMSGAKLKTTLLNTSINQGLTPVRLSEEKCIDLVYLYRNKNAKIKKLWQWLQGFGIGAMITGQRIEFKSVVFDHERIELPSGLSLFYPFLDGKITTQRNGDPYISDTSYEGSKGKTHIYSGLLLENIVQALARIIVSDVMRIIAKVYRIVMITHDEIVFVVPRKEAKKALAWAIDLMSVSPAWAPDLPLSAEGSHGTNYSK